MKRRKLEMTILTELTYPPPAGGGLIEATPSPSAPSGGRWYPPPAGGGLIEASADSLREKLHLMYPPPAGGGLIEA